MFSWSREACGRPSLSVPICKEDENMAAILLCKSFFPETHVSCPQNKTRQNNFGNEIIRTLTSIDNWLIYFGMSVKDTICFLSCRVFEQLRHIYICPWIVSAAIKTKWTIDICFPSFTLVYGRIFLRFSRVFLFWMARWKHKGRTQYLFHVRFQSCVKLVWENNLLWRIGDHPL